MYFQHIEVLIFSSNFYNINDNSASKAIFHCMLKALNLCMLKALNLYASSAN